MQYNKKNRSDTPILFDNRLLAGKIYFSPSNQHYRIYHLYDTVYEYYYEPS